MATENHHSIRKITDSKKDSSLKPKIIETTSKNREKEKFGIPKPASTSNILQLKTPPYMKITNATKIEIIKKSDRPLTPRRQRAQEDVSFLKIENIKKNSFIANPSKVEASRNPNDLSNLSNKISRSVSPTPSCSDVEKRNNYHVYSTINNNIKFDYNKIYSKREKSELNFIRGNLKPSKNSNINTIGSKNNYVIEMNNYKVLLFKFLRPSMPVLNIDFTSCAKYEPSSIFLKNSILTNKKKDVAMKRRDEELTNDKSYTYIVEDNKVEGKFLSLINFRSSYKHSREFRKIRNYIKQQIYVGKIRGRKSRNRPKKS